MGELCPGPPKLAFQTASGLRNHHQAQRQDPSKMPSTGQTLPSKAPARF